MPLVIAYKTERGKMSKLNIEIDEETIKEVLLIYLQEKLGGVKLAPNEITIEVKSKQNYRAEWEPAKFRASVSKVWRRSYDG